MGYLSADELDAMREDAADTLDSTCSIQSITKTRDSIGALSNNGTATRSDVPCRYMAGADGWEALVGSKPQHGNVGMFSLNGTLTLNLTDVIVYNTIKYNIRGVNIQDGERMLTRVAVETANG
jgi:hypothetical protein